MAIYENKVRYVAGGYIADYFIDSAADIPNLPGIDKIKGSSTAFDISTGDVYMLRETGWRLM